MKKILLFFFAIICAAQSGVNGQPIGDNAISASSGNTIKPDNSHSISFFVASGTRYKGINVRERNLIQAAIDDMNSLPGTDFLSSISRKVDVPDFVAFCGNITENGGKSQINKFAQDMGLKGEGRLKYPVYEGFGNYDGSELDNNNVVNFLSGRNKRRDVVEISKNGLHYGWELEGVHFVQLNLFAGDEIKEADFNNVGNKPYLALDFLRQYLERNVGSSGAPVVIFQHYGWDDNSIDGGENNGTWSTNEREAFYEAIKGYNVVGIFCGDSPTTNISKWHGFDVYNVGDIHLDTVAGTYMVCNISDDTMTVVVREGNKQWNETAIKTILRPDPDGITFYGISDIHYGLLHASEFGPQNIDAMNNLPGTNYPSEIGGIVGKPRGVLIPGDWTVRDAESELWQYKLDWGLNGERLLKFPVFDTFGNHDGNRVREEIKARNLARKKDINISENGLHYSFDWDSVHFVSLGIYPGNERVGGYDPHYSLDFLIKDLDANVKNSGKPVVLFQHFGFGTHSLAPEYWWSKAESEAFYRVIKNYNVIVIIHGHEHDHFFNKWKGIDIVNLPHYGDERHGFCVFNIKGTQFKAAYHTTNEGWTGSFQKQISLGSVNWNIKPKVKIVAPVEAEYFKKTGVLKLTADASDEDGHIISVEFFADGKLMGAVDSPPYTLQAHFDKSGYYEIYAKATDNLGAFSESDFVVVAIGEDINKAPFASISTSYVSPWENLQAIANRIEPENSGDKTGGAYGNWTEDSTLNKWNWVQYDWPEEIDISRSEVYWWVDGSGIEIPINTYLSYWDRNKKAWLEVSNPNVNGVRVPANKYGSDSPASSQVPSAGCERDRYNSTTFQEISTSKLRVNFISPGAQGILEWKVFKNSNK